MIDIEQTIKVINKYKIITIVRSVSVENIVPMANALNEGGIKLIEVTFNQSNATGEKETAAAIQAICDNFGDELCVGAGTVISEKQVEIAIEAGAKYIISPNTDFNVIKKTLDLGAISIPGALSPSEIANAYKEGAHYVKLFPAGNLGADYIKAVRAPLSHIPMMAVGGVNDKNLMDFLNLGLSGVGIGSNIVDKKIISEGRFKELTALAKKYTSQLM